MQETPAQLQDTIAFAAPDSATRAKTVFVEDDDLAEISRAIHDQHGEALAKHRSLMLQHVHGCERRDEIVCCMQAYRSIMDRCLFSPAQQAVLWTEEADVDRVVEVYRRSLRKCIDELAKGPGKLEVGLLIDLAEALEEGLAKCLEMEGRREGGR